MLDNRLQEETRGTGAANIKETMSSERNYRWECPHKYETGPQARVRKESRYGIRQKHAQKSRYESHEKDRKFRDNQQYQR